ncbi:aromatic amino acid transaminase [Sphingomonas sp. MG17]|uniref:Aromatic amino acid transaminase n=1 Tax=Sphingomonas tagetis TaxID=2949092 RepID=A0A9X2KNF0_9SPHN|nr:aromatic amino acid transaminase [Sphingomonas tagetis]
MFDTLDRQPPDALLAVIGMHRADPRPDKIDVGVGVYRDETGTTPVMGAVKAAEARLLSEQVSKSYLGAEGDQTFTDSLAHVALGEALAADSRITGIQTPGGTGALRLAAELLARTERRPTVWVGAPTWPNHAPIFGEAGLRVASHGYFDAARGDLDFNLFVDGLTGAQPGDVVLLHGCCHNPTGTAFDAAQWQQLATMVVARGLVPLVDLAYQGLGRGLAEDAAGMRALLTAAPEALVAYSCDKNFALYRERVGALWVQAPSPAVAVPVRETLLVLARSLWSMPPDHGAAAVREILSDAALSADWQAELTGMCERINALRLALGQAHPALAPIARQQGLFALLPIDRGAVRQLRERHAIYMPDSGRINIAGLRHETVAPFIDALAPHLPLA